jgi:tellurite resistance protein
MLTRFDRIRLRHKDYRRGWNSLPAIPPAARPPVVTPTPNAADQSDSSPIIAVLMLGGLAWLFFSKRGSKRPPRTSVAPTVTVAKTPTDPHASPAAVERPHARSARPKDLRDESDVAWKRKNEAVEVQGIRIAKGMIYVADHLTAKDSYGQVDNCLINPRLSIVGGGDADTGLSYWPSYCRVPAATKRKYLEWLAGDRDDPTTPVGYIFLYFYGLERRLMLDQALDERLELIAEVERLRGIYGGNASFRGYSGRLLSAAGALARDAAPCDPVFKREGYDLPLRLRETLGRFAAAGTAIPADWMLSWVMNHPEYSLRTPATRDIDTFRELFAQRWAKAKPEGALFTDAQLARFPRLRWTYRAASNTFHVDGALQDGLPDVGGATMLVRKAHDVALKCCDELDAYSRLVGRRPDLKGSLAADALLPQDMAPPQRARQRIAALMASGELGTVAAIVALIAGEAEEKVTAAQWRKVVDTLRSLGFGAAPDPALTLTRISGSSAASLFPLPKGSDDVNDAMSALAIVLQVGALVAHADGNVSPEEHEELQQVVQQPGLDARQKARLAAQADWLLNTTSHPADLRSRLAKISDETRGWIVDLALDVARGDGHVVAAEVRQLEQIFGWLGLPTTRLYSALHGSDPVEIAPASSPKPGEPIPATETQPSTPVALPRRRLDRDRIAAITRDSARSAQLLQTVFASDEDDIAEPPPPVPVVEDPTFAGLVGAPLTFTRDICVRDSWPRHEIEAIARKQSLMLDGVIERVNDWSLDALGDLLIEDGEPVRINLDLLRITVGVE